MKKLFFAVAILCGLGLTANAQNTTGSNKEGKGEVNRRLENQNDRINQGAKSGELTKNETKTLRTEEKGLRSEVKAERKANGGHLNKQEKQNFNRQLNRESREIHRDKHNQREVRGRK